MRLGLAFQVAPIELMQTLKRDGATLLGAKQRGDFLPRLALLALFADELHERFEAAAIGPPAAISLRSFLDSESIHASLGQCK